MDIRQLRYFIAAAEYVNFTAAAKHIYISQQALSQQISELESDLGVILFNRKRNSISLTAAGEALLHEAKAIVSQTEEAIKLTRQIASGISGKLKVGYLGFAERYFLPKLLYQFRQKYPSIQLSCKQLSHGAIDDTLEHAEIDIGFIQVWETTKLTNICWHKLYADELCLIVPANHPWAGRTDITRAELSKEDFIFHPQNAPRAYTNLKRVCSNRGFSPSVDPVSDIMTVLMMVEAGFGISLLPRHIPLGYASPTLNILTVVGDDISVDVAVAWNRNNDNPSISLFLKVMESFLASTHSLNPIVFQKLLFDTQRTGTVVPSSKDISSVPSS
ncbi:LysR family transcriptional regulator [Sporomusa acidovorans]|uniref:Hca operon transcriptional activator HcaR n=1 Tax=Sporomusa acidovorans (strain ATCC 49682 / DSM 3132 / Mol) TaxID=1123286 RepID=A0ABZ3JAR3_SPOA4|nr:LysR family transcriptional regulator [Sporomusa acidovorans]OZC16985.1 Hca operon transcriptional activator [Sporomusa acidovorans DSM 3132]SDF33324.1 transcriptional regulator, LysR family [Sporomusa acidovorans]